MGDIAFILNVKFRKVMLWLGRGTHLHVLLVGLDVNFLLRDVERENARAREGER